MAQDNYPEQEAGNRKQEASEQTAEEKSGFEVQEAGSPAEQDLASPDRKSERPVIPDTSKPGLPQEEGIPTDGPGDQGQAQPSTTQPQTQEEKAKRIKAGLKKLIHTGTPRERVESSEIEGKHNKDVLNQP